MNKGQAIGSSEIKQIISNTFSGAVRQYSELLSLGKIFETMGESKAAADCYLAFARNVLKYQQEQDNIDYFEILNYYSMSLGSMNLNSFSGPINFVLAAYYLAFLHMRFVVNIISDKVCFKESVPKKFKIAGTSSAAKFLSWVKNPNGNRTLQSIAEFEYYVRELASSDKFQFVSNIKKEEICKKWCTALTVSVPLNRETEFIFPYEQ